MDTGTSQHICNDKSLFVDKLIKCNGVEIGGIGGSVTAKGVGTIQLSLIDDQHRSHNIILHNILYVPASPVNLISPKNGLKKVIQKRDQIRELSSVLLEMS